MEDGIGNWMIEWNYDMMLRERIACPERDYPQSEALYPSIEAWEKANGKVWYEEFQP